MIFLKFLGTLDFLAAIVLILSAIRICPFRSAFALALYLFLKGLIYRGDFASMIDMGIAFLIIIVYFFGVLNFFGILTIIAIVYLLQKALFSWSTI